MFSQCLAYPGVRYLMGRRELTNLKRTTLASFFKMIGELNLMPEDYFTINNQINVIKFHNGSEIILMDMAYKPSDPEYLRFGGLELTGAFIDESNDCDEKAITILKTRIGRCRNQKYKIVPKILETFNPSKNHVYFRYYQPYKHNELPEHVMFLPAVATDNSYLDPNYIKQLDNSDEVTRQRLLYGNFDYDDDERALCTFDAIQDTFYNDFVEEGDKYISSDLAMQGRDNFVVTSWNGLRCRFPVIKNRSTGKEIEEVLKEQMSITKTSRSHTVADSDGLGNYLGSYLNGIKEFHGGKSPTDKTQFRNIKTECAFKLAELINKREIFLDVPEDKEVVVGGKKKKLRTVLIEELSQLKRNNVDKDDRKKELITKDEMKKNIGRSPDFLDCLIMRMWFILSCPDWNVMDSSNNPFF